MAKNFKSNKAYKSWLAYGHASGKFAETPGHQSVSIKGKRKKVKHEHGGPHDSPYTKLPEVEINSGPTYVSSLNDPRYQKYLQHKALYDELNTNRLTGIARSNKSSLASVKRSIKNIEDLKENQTLDEDQLNDLKHFRQKAKEIESGNFHRTFKNLPYKQDAGYSFDVSGKSKEYLDRINELGLESNWLAKGTDSEYYLPTIAAPTQEYVYDETEAAALRAEEAFAKKQALEQQLQQEQKLNVSYPEGSQLIQEDFDPAFGTYGNYMLTPTGEHIPVGKTKEDYEAWKQSQNPKNSGVEERRLTPMTFQYGGPKYPSGPYYPYKGSTLRVNKGYDKNHVQPSVFPNGGKLVTIGDKTYDTSSEEYRKLVESGKVKPYTTDTESGIGAFDYGNLPDFEVTAPTQEAVDMAKRAFNRSKQGQAKQQDTQNFLNNNRYRYPESGATKGILESMVEGVIDDPNNLSYYPGAGELYDAGHLGHSLRQGNYEDAAYDAAAFAIPFAGGAAVKKFLKPYLKNAYKYNPWAYKPDPKSVYRGIGKEGAEDALQSGVFRPKQNVDPNVVKGFDLSKDFNKTQAGTYYSPNFKTADKYGKGYIAEVPSDAADFIKRYKSSDWSLKTQDNIPIEKGRVLKKHWLKGYTPIKKSSSNPLPNPLRNLYKYNPFATNLESKIAKENLLARQIYGDEAYENFLKHGPATEYGKNVPRHKQIRRWLDADTEDVVVRGKAGKNEGKFEVASSIEGGNFKYPYFQKSSLFFSPTERALYNADMGKGRVIIPKDVDAKNFYPAGETSYIRNVDTAPKDAAKMYSGEKYILSPFDKNSFNSKAFDVYEETPHWLMGNKKIKKHGGPHIDPTALEQANVNINTANTSASNYFNNPDNFAATQKMLNEYANVGNYKPITYSGGFTNTGNTVFGGYNSPVNQSNTLTGGEFYNDEKITDLPIVSYNDFIDKKGQHFYVPNYGIKTPTAPIDRNLATETAQRPVIQNVPLQTNKRKSKVKGANNKYMKNVNTKHFQTQALDEQGNPIMEDYSVFKQGDKTINERTYNAALRNQQAEQTKYELDLLKTQELIDQYKTYGGSIKKKYPNGGNDKTVPSWINKSITSRPNYVERLPTQEELDKIKYTKDYTPTFKQQVLIDKGLLSYKDAYKGEGEKTKTAWNKYSDPLSREQIDKLYSKEDAIKLGLKREDIENLDASTMNTLQKFSPLPNNINELIGAEVIGDARLNNESLSDEEKILLYNNIQNAVKRTGNPERGGIEYADYGNQGYGSPEQFEDWFVNNNIGPQNLKSNLINTALSAFNPVPGSTAKALYTTAKDIATPLTNSYTNPGFNLASTIGRGKYWQDEKDPDTYYYTDRYDWGKGAGGNKGDSFFKKGLDYLRDTESSNTKNTEVDKRKIQFKLTKSEIDKLIAERNASAQANGGYMKYADGGTILPSNKMPSVNNLSLPPLSEQIMGLSPETTGDKEVPKDLKELGIGKKEFTNFFAKSKLAKNWKGDDVAENPYIAKNAFIAMQALSDYGFNPDKPTEITGTYRPPKVNKENKGAKKSDHLMANAADVRIGDPLVDFIKTDSGKQWLKDYNIFYKDETNREGYSPHHHFSFRFKDDKNNKEKLKNYNLYEKMYNLHKDKETGFVDMKKMYSDYADESIEDYRTSKIANKPIQNIPIENMRKDILNPIEAYKNNLAFILPNNQFNMGGYMKYANGAELETDPPFTKEQFKTAMGSADMSLGVKPFNRSEQYQFYTGKPYKGDRTPFDRGMTALATTGIGAAIGATKKALDYKNKYEPRYRQEYDDYMAKTTAQWPDYEMSFDEYLDFHESSDRGYKKDKATQIGAAALAKSIPGFLSNFLVNRGLDAIRMKKNKKHREALEAAKELGEATDEEIIEFRNQQKHGGYMQYVNGGQFDTGGQMGEFSSVPVTEFNNGGSHEANALGGIPQGPSALVEEGELKLDLPSGEQFIVSPKIMYKKNDKEVEAIAQELGISEKEFKRFAGKDMVSVFKSLTRKNSFNAEKREGDTIQENSIEADIMPFVELHTFLTERKNAQEEAKKEQAFAQDMDMMMQEHPEYMQAMMAQQQQQGPSPEEQAMMEQQMMQQQGGAPQGMPPMMGTYGGMLEYKNGGLWANIHAKRARIKAGSGESMRTPGSTGAPTAQALKDSQTYGGKMNPDGSVVHFNNGGYSYSDYLAPQQAMPVQGVAASGYAQGGMMPQQYKYGAGLGIASDVLGGAASVVGNIPGIGTALGAGLGTLAGTAGYLSDNAAASEDGKVGDIDPAQLALEAGMGAGAGALGFAGATAVNLGGETIDQFTDSKEDKKNAKTALILQDPTHPEYEEVKARELEKQKALKGTGAIGAGIGLASNIIGGKVAAKNAAGVADADFLESGANLADWAPENTTTAIDPITGLASSMAPPQMAQGGYMKYMHGGAMKYPTGGPVLEDLPKGDVEKQDSVLDLQGDLFSFSNPEDSKSELGNTTDPNWFNNLTQQETNALMSGAPYIIAKDGKKYNNPNPDPNTWASTIKSDPMMARFANNGFNNYNTNTQNNTAKASANKGNKSKMTLMDDIEDFDSDAAEEAELDAQTEAEMFADAPKVTRKPDLTYKNPDTLKYNTRETNYLKPTFLENVLAASPGIANIAMGLGKDDKLKLDRIDPISAKYISLDESRKANERLLAAQQDAAKNVAGNAGGGNYLANMQATYLKYLQGMSGIDQQEQNANAQIANQTAAQNARIAAQNAQMGFREQDYAARTKAAKQGMIGTGIGQIADVYQGNRQNKFLAENYFPLVAPNYSDYYKYETKAGAKRRAKKNK